MKNAADNIKAIDNIVAISLPLFFDDLQMDAEYIFQELVLLYIYIYNQVKCVFVGGIHRVEGHYLSRAKHFESFVSIL